MFKINIFSKIKVNYINFLNLFFFRDILDYKKKLLKLYKFLNIEKNIIFLGRARTGIYVLIDYYLNKFKKGKKNVLIVPFTIPDIVKLIKRAGGNPIFLDFDKRSTFISLVDLKLKIKKYKPQLLILTHYHLQEKNMQGILKLCKQNNIIIIEDKAVSYGALNNSKIYGDAAIFSFSTFKLLNFYYGGALICKKDSDYSSINLKIKNWKPMTILQYFKQVFLTTIYQILTNKFIFNYLGFYIFNYNFLLKKKNEKKYYFSKGNFDKSYLTKPSSGFFKEILHKIDDAKLIQKHRVQVFKTYNKYLNKISVPKKITSNQMLKGSCYNYLIYHKESEKIREELISKKIDTGRFLYENLNKSYQPDFQIKATNNLDELSKNLIVLPTHILITKEYAKKIAKTINKIIDNLS